MGTGKCMWCGASLGTADSEWVCRACERRRVREEEGYALTAKIVLSELTRYGVDENKMDRALRGEAVGHGTS